MYLVVEETLFQFSNLVHFGYSVYFDNSVIIRHNKYFICSGSLVNNLYIINLISPMLQLSEMNNTNSSSSKRKTLLK